MNTQDEQPLKKETKKKPLLEPENTSDLAWGIKFFAEGIQGLTKKMQKDNSAQAQVIHNAELIQKLKAEIASKEAIKEQFQEYKALVDRYNALMKEEASKPMPKKKGIFK